MPTLHASLHVMMSQQLLKSSLESLKELYYILPSTICDLESKNNTIRRYINTCDDDLMKDKEKSEIHITKRRKKDDDMPP